MKAIFASMKLEDGTSDFPSPIEKGKNTSSEVAVAHHQDSYVNHQDMKGVGPHTGHDDSYQLAFDDSQGFWDEGEGGGTYGNARPPGYR
jgi:hypothetical protein